MKLLEFCQFGKKEKKKTDNFQWKHWKNLNEISFIKSNYKKNIRKYAEFNFYLVFLYLKFLSYVFSRWKYNHLPFILKTHENGKVERGSEHLN